MGIGTIIFFGVKQALKIVLGIAFTVAVFFGVGWLVDWNATKNARLPDHPKFLPYADRLKSPEAQIPNRSQASAPKPSDRVVIESPAEQKPLPQQMPSVPTQQEPHVMMPEQQLTTPKPTQQPSSAKPIDRNSSAASSPQNVLSAGLTYTIQLGSFQNEAVAKAFSESLVAKGYPAYILQTDVAGKGTVYRVRIGKFKTMEDAQAMAVELEKKENVSAFITSR